MLSRNDKKIVALYSGLALLFIYPLIQAGIFYRDDLDRAITGQYGWNGLGRPLADLLMRILSASGHYNLDLFPYTMIASCALLGFSALLFKKHLDRSEVPQPIFIAALLLFNPFMLQNMAYRYDSLGMALAFLLAVLAYAFTHKNVLIENSLRILSGLLVLMLYQPCANIYIGLLAADMIIIGLKGNETASNMVRLIAKKALIFIAFYGIYMLLMAHKSIPRAELIPLNGQGLQNLSGTLHALYEMVSSYFHGPVYIYFLIPLLSSVILSVIKAWNKKENTLSFYLCPALSVIVFLVSLMGPAILLKESPVLPRMLVSFSMLFIMFALPLVFFCPKLKWLALIPVITSFAFSAQVCSAMKSQREYESFVFEMISRDVISHQHITSVRTVGQVAIGERAKILLQNKPLIGYFLSPATQFLASFQLIDKGLKQTTQGYVDENYNKQLLQKMIASGIKPEISNAEYSIYFQNDMAMVKLGPAGPPFLSQPVK